VNIGLDNSLTRYISELS